MEEPAELFAHITAYIKRPFAMAVVVVAVVPVAVMVSRSVPPVVIFVVE